LEMCIELLSHRNCISISSEIWLLVFLKDIGFLYILWHLLGNCEVMEERV